MSIIIGADMVPTKSNMDLFSDGDGISLVGDELHKVLCQVDYRIFNLEVPLTDKTSPIMKQGPNLVAPTSTIRGYSALKVDLLTLANNHIMDQGEKGLYSTIHTLSNAGIDYVGAGSTLQEAQEPFIIHIESRKIGIYACAEHEFSIAEDDKPGANPFDPLWSLDHVESLKKEVDYVIVLYHGGKEHYRYPSPMLQKKCRKLVDKGADLVICQHSHCIGCEEDYQTRKIIYGQGNFIFDDSEDECWQSSLLVKLDDDFSISYLPIIKYKNRVRLAQGKKADDIMNDFHLRSEEIKRPLFITNNYAKYSQLFTNYYLGALSGKRSYFFRVLNKLVGGRCMTHYLNNAYGTPEQLRIANYIECEAHRELLLQVLSNRYKVKK